MVTTWKRGDLFKQEIGDRSRELYGVVCGTTVEGGEERVHAVVITFPIAEYFTSALSALVAERRDMPEGCVPAYPETLPAAVRPQLLSILAAFY